MINLSEKQQWDRYVSLLQNMEIKWEKMKRNESVTKSIMFILDFHFHIVNKFIEENTEEDVMGLARRAIPLIQLLEKEYNKSHVDQTTYEEKVAFARLFLTNPN